jgi:hypothetical protein
VIVCFGFRLLEISKTFPFENNTVIVEQIETFRSDIKNSRDLRTDRQDNMQTERQDDRQSGNPDKIKTQIGETADDRLTERQTDRKIDGQIGRITCRQKDRKTGRQITWTK